MNEGQLPSITYDVVFNEGFKTFEIWQLNNDFDTKALLQSYSLELITQLLKENFVNALLLLGGKINNPVPESDPVSDVMRACDCTEPEAIMILNNIGTCKK